MPEGPEIRRAADRIARVLDGTTADSVWFAHDHLESWGERLSGREILSVEPRGKALLTRFAGGENIYSHNQLYGRWYVMPAGKTPRTTRQLRLAIRTHKHAALLYSASEIEVLPDSALLEHPYLQKLGPDVLQDDIDSEVVLRHIADARFRRRRLGGLLLDQGFVSGIGNYLRTEILFVARLDADLRPMDLDDAQLETLADTTVAITRRAYRLRGITNDPDDARAAKAAGEPRRTYRHYAFSRAGKPCRLCGEAVQKRESAGRRLYFCRVCQPAARPGS